MTWRPLPILLMLLLLSVTIACGEQPGLVSEETPEVLSGAAVLASNDYAPLHGKRVGLIGNHTSLAGDTHLIDLLAEHQEVELVALFGPEHGLRGTADAGAEIEDAEDPETGIPIYSLYGETRRPTPDMLEDVDALIFDMQDVGARFYTFISTMGLAMQSAAEAGIPFYVLDRPNPLGGIYMSGFVLEENQQSFVGQYPIPTVHGMTIGELALMIRGEEWLDDVAGVDLHVIELEGWSREMQWEALSEPWVAPSPNIPDFETALLYPGTCLIEATSASEGRGTDAPFRLIGHPNADADSLAHALRARELFGVKIEAATFTPESRPGATSPKHEGTTVHGIRVSVTDSELVDPVVFGVHLLDVMIDQLGEEVIDQPSWLDRLAGTSRLREMLIERLPPEEIIDAWIEEVEAFTVHRAPYLLYTIE